MDFSLKPGVSLAETENGTVLLDEGAAKYWSLNESGTVIFRVLLEGGSLDDVVTALIEEFEIDEATALHDARRLTDDFKAAGLIRR
ncbi:putative lasso peptide modification enzyme [Planomonospora sphaerica]|uniref:Putative lasso peptide modification enzyme n=1 Tax=Planomonospora sphaerica TaxID=161355 RepID=A0A171DJY7_9ACTN|nr:lasso peptide biosynthesis PqqD family chaperone [Planomonospora sphaerica]GAT69130.1 putative lasso peptide modification enzyme [Planomonospora sphaerica]